MQTRAWLRQNIAGYLHDGSLSAELDTFIDLGAKRISQLMQCVEMEAEITRNKGDANNFIAVPADFQRLLGVQVADNGTWRNLQAISRHDAAYFDGAGLAMVYRIDGGVIQPLPASDSDYRVQYLQEAIVPEDSAETNAVLSAYPMVFLNAALVEAYDWKQDFELVGRFEQKLMGDIRAITRIYLSERAGEVPAMRAV